MRARTIAYIAAACAPVWLLALLAIQGRYFISPYSELEYGPLITKDILAYSQPLNFTAHYLDAIVEQDTVAVDKVANYWIKLHENGKLKDIEILALNDHGFSGFRSEIEMYRRTLISAIDREYSTAIRNQDWETASIRQNQILQICEISKYNSPISTAYSAHMQRQTVETFLKNRQNFSESQQDAFLSSLATTNPDPERIIQELTRISRLSKQVAPDPNITLPSEYEVQLVFQNQSDKIFPNNSAEAQGLVVTRLYSIAYQNELQFAEQSAPFRKTLLGLK
ncbi:hypothetical protein CCB80_07235 [Armatimonadetes bacterium Uphvl-Ar1]|nr:hypothetical protein CCB80_07235 [Armatimonadetes bacterium Uphvl-Ar1]